MSPPKLNPFLFILIFPVDIILIFSAITWLMMNVMFRFIRGIIFTIDLDAKNKIDTCLEQNVGLEHENKNLKEENGKLKEKMAKMEAYMKELKSSIRRRGMPVELLVELFASLPLKNAYGLLEKMPNGLLARNVQKMIQSFKMTMKENTWNLEDCGTKLAISEDGFVINHIGPIEGENCARAYFPIPSIKFASNKPKFVSYFEVEILKEIWDGCICIGFCCKKFPLENNLLGDLNNSIGIGLKIGIWIDGFENVFENDNGIFKEGDVIGLGLIHQPNSLMECFATLNDKLFGKVALPPKYANLELFPAVNLFLANERIRANFGNEKWRFKLFQDALEINAQNA